MSLTVVRKRIATISGTPASGKSNAAKASAAELGYRHFSTGDLMRKLGVDRGLTILDTNKVADTDDELDRIVDGELVRIGQEEQDLVLDSRMGWYFIKGALRVFMHAPFDVAAQRIIDDMDEVRRASEDVCDDPEIVAEQLAERQRLEEERYRTKYNVNPFDPKNYDIVIRTDQFPESVAKTIIVAAFRDLHNL